MSDRETAEFGSFGQGARHSAAVRASVTTWSRERSATSPKSRDPRIGADLRIRVECREFCDISAVGLRGIKNRMSL
jgi:hypothetical protein